MRDIGLMPKTTLLESSQSNGMAEAFVRTFKRDYVRVSDPADAQTVLRSLPAWFTHYNEVHPPSRPGIQVPKAVHPCHPDNLTCPIFRGQQQLHPCFTKLLTGSSSPSSLRLNLPFQSRLSRISYT